MFDFLKGPVSKREKVYSIAILIATILLTIAVHRSFLLFKDLTRNAHQSINMAAQSVKQIKRVKEDSELRINMYEKYLNLCEDDFERTKKKLDECNASSTELIIQKDKIQKALGSCNSIYGK
ncbi:MAG: hypothetical protein KAS07_03005 [Candidatus Pacebacteria bacterium]|nr:hypothetical protein [Candidatus Paceibacterota bacterium]